MTEKELQAKWERILKREGLSMSRGSTPRTRLLRDSDAATCPNCQGMHTQDPECSYQGK